MPDRMFRFVLAAAMTVALAVFFIDPQPRGNPADEEALAKIVDGALDSNSPQRFTLWHAAHEQIVRLDPNRPTAASTFVRTGLFHWYELGDADRRSVIAAIEPLLRDPAFFNRMAQPLFQLTGDFTILRRANPGTEGAMSNLASMAVMNGRFADYRQFREQLRKRRLATFETTRRNATPAELIALVPVVATMADKPLLQGILDQLHVRPIDNAPVDGTRINTLIDFALDHEMQPLDGLEAVIHIAHSADDPQRARLALHLGHPDLAADLERASPVADKTQWHRYYVEGAVAEMRRHEPLLALQYLQKAGDGVDAIAATEEVQRIVGNNADAAATHAVLLAKANRIEQWQGGCGADICEHADGMLWTNGMPFAMKFTAVQSDDVPPYAEIYTDDAMTAEGPVSPSLIAHSQLLRGVHRIDVRLANPVTRNAIRRRVRVE